MQIKDVGIEFSSLDENDLIPVQKASGTTGRIKKANLIISTSGNQEYPSAFTHWHDESIVISGSPLAYDLNTAYHYQTISYQNPPNINDSFKFVRLLTSGQYRISVSGHRFFNRGRLKLEINGSLAFDDLDFYGDSAAISLTRTIAISSSGQQEFKFTVFSKNPSSSNYIAAITKIFGVKI